MSNSNLKDVDKHYLIKLLDLIDALYLLLKVGSNSFESRYVFKRMRAAYQSINFLSSVKFFYSEYFYKNQLNTSPI